MTDVNKQLLKDQEELRQEIIKTSEASYRALVIDPMQTLARLPESVFVKEFFPYFSGKLPMPETLLPIWIGIAGSPTSEVQIINDAGEKLYTVPPMSDTTTVDIAKGSTGSSMKQILTNYALYKNVTPQRGKAYIDHALTVKAAELEGQSASFATNQQRWNDIFERYDGSIKKSSTSTNSKDQSDDEEFEYE